MVLVDLARRAGQCQRGWRGLLKPGFYFANWGNLAGWPVDGWTS